MKKTEHFVQVYEQDAFLLQSLAGYLTDGFWQGERGIVIATSAHRLALENCLVAKGVDVISKVVTAQYIALDAEETLEKFMRGGQPDPQLFDAVVGSLVRRATRGGRILRAFGEMVALLWEAGNPSGAIKLEELWNDLAKRSDFSLFCAYPAHCFAGGASGTLAQVCQSHSRVIPSESFLGEAATFPFDSVPEEQPA